MEHFVEFEDVCKYYQTGSVKIAAADHLNFYVEKGEFCIIVGPSGVGKTTLLNILAALDKPTAGRVELDGRDMAAVRESDAAAFRRDNLGFVFQEFNLLDTFTLEDNIYLPLVLMGRTYEDMRARLLPVARELGLTELLKKYPYEVSGGQKQRIAIARVFLKNPPILILDEATSALDNESEILVGQSLEKLAHGRTTLTIAHRLTTIKDYDRILVLGEEGIVESGTHEQLLAKQGVYYRLWNQLPAEDGE